jgi:hypothetical protein
LAFSCLVNLVGNISDPTKTPFTCSPAALQANKDISLVKDIMTPVQKKMLEDNKEKIVNFHQALEDQDDMVKLIEKGKFTAAEKMLTDGLTKEENDGGYNADVVKTLNETIDKISNGYSTMTIESGLEMLETLFTETYPTIIGTNTQTDIKIKKDVLNALSTAVYRKLEVVGAFYSKDGLVGEDYLQSKIYSLLQLVVMMPETYPGHKSSIYWTVARLGFKGVTTSMGGITNIDIPENLQKESDKKKLLDEKNSEDIKLITPDNGGSGTIKIDTNPAIDTTKTVIPNKK